MKKTDALEKGVCTVGSNGRYDVENADGWLDICDINNVSYACWAISNSYELAVYFKEELAKYDGNCTEDDLTTHSKYIINRYNDCKEEAEDLQIEEKLCLEEEPQLGEETIGEEISQANDNVSKLQKRRVKVR